MNKWTKLLVEEDGQMMIERAIFMAFISVLIIGTIAGINMYGIKVQAALENVLRLIN